MNYSIKRFEIIEHSSRLFIQAHDFAAALDNPHLQSFLRDLRSQKKNEISSMELDTLALKHCLPSEGVKNLLLNTMNIIKPHIRPKLDRLYINADEALITEVLAQTFAPDYEVTVTHRHDYPRTEKALVLFYRNQYTSEDYQAMYRALHDNLYLITAGVAHQLLVIDNLFYKNSGLPSHFSNVNQLLGAVQSGMPISQTNWVVFYRELMQKGSESLPSMQLDASQYAFAAYCLANFARQFTGLCSGTALMDKLNWFWHVDLKDGTILKDVAVHSPFSAQDMGLTFAADAAAVEA